MSEAVNQFDNLPLAEQSWAFLNVIGRDKEWTPIRKPRVVTSSTNVNPLDDTHLVDCTAGAVTLTLETCVAGDGRKHTFKKTDSSSNAMIIDGLGSQTVEGAATVSTIIQGITFIVWSDGIGGWYSVILAPGTASAGGSITSIGMTVPVEFSVSPSSIADSGTFAITKATESANLVWAGPTTGSAAQPTFRSLVTADIANDMITYAKIQNVSAASRIIGRGSASGSGDAEELTVTGSLSISGTALQNYTWIAYRLCHKDTALTTGELEIDYPPGFTFLDAYVSVDTVSSSGLPTFDIKESGTTMLSTLITVDVSENTSKTAATPPVISDSTFTAFNKLSLHCTVAGTGTKGAILHMKVLWT